MTWISKVSGLAKSALPTAVADGESANILVDLYGRIRLAVEDAAANALRIMEINPLSSHHVEETLLDLTNIATNTTGYAYLDMDGFRYFSLQMETSGTAPTDVLTITVEGSNQDDGTAPASCTYQDVTNGRFGVASWVDTDAFAICDTACPFKYVRVKYVTSNDAGNDCDLTVYAKRMY